MSRRVLRRNVNGTRLADLVGLVGDSGVSNLPDYLTINAQTVAPTFIYRGYDATASEWPGYWGETLDIAGSGDLPLLNQPALGNGTFDEAVKGEAGKRYQATSTSFADVTTEDFVYEIVGQWRSGGVSQWMYSKRDGITGPGVEQYFDGASGNGYFRITDDLANTITIRFNATPEDGDFFHAIIFIDRSGSGVCYFNNAQGTAQIVSSVGSLSNASGLIMLGRGDSSQPGNSSIVQVSMWLKDAWLDTHLQAAVAAERFYQWSGLYGKVTTGTPEPTVYTRAFSAYAQKWNTGTSSYDLLNCASGVPRVDRVKDENGVIFEGMLIEPQVTNLLDYSNDINNAYWGKTRTDINTTTGVYTPDANVEYMGMVATAVDGSHKISRSITCTANPHSFSAIIKRGVSTLLRLSNDTAGEFVVFDIENGTIDSSTGTDAYSIEDMGNDNYLCNIVDTVGAGSVVWAAYVSDASGNLSFTGDGVSTYAHVGFLQLEEGTKPTSRIVTAGATASRLADSLQYNGDNVTAGQGAFVAEVLRDGGGAGVEVTYQIDDGTIANRVYHLAQFSASDPRFAGVDTSVTQWSISGTSLDDNQAHKLRTVWETNNAKQYTDGVLDGTPDTSCTIPTGLTVINIGQSEAGVKQLNGRIRNFQIWPWAEENLG